MSFSKKLYSIQKIINNERNQNTSRLLPPFSTYSNVHFFEDQVSNQHKGFIFLKQTLSNFEKKSFSLRHVFSDGFLKKGRLSAQILTHLSAEMENNVSQFLPHLEKAKTSKEALIVLDKMISGSDGSKSRKFLNALAKIELLQESVKTNYEKKASEQNPLFDFLQEENIKFEKIDKVLLATQISKDHTLSFILQSLKEIKHASENTPSHALVDKLNSGEYNTELVDIYTGPNARSLALDIKAIERKLHIEKLEEIHSFSTSFSQNIVEKSFDVDSEKLADLIPLKGDDVATREKNRRGISSMLEKGILQTGFSYIPTPLRNEIIYSVSKKLTDENSPLDSAIHSSDIFYNNKIEKGVPPNARIDEVFHKMLEDTIYNAFMKEKGGLELFNTLSNQKERAEMIDVASNTTDGKYISVSEDKRLEKDAISVYNLTKILDEIDNGTLSKEDGTYLLKNEIPSLDSKTKEALLDNIDTLHNAKKIERTLGKDNQEPFHTVKEVGDQIMQKYVNNYYNSRYGKEGFFNKGLRSLTGLSLVRDAAATLLGCMRNAENPMIKHHSTSSESSQCLDTALRKIRENIDGARQAVSSPIVAASGLSFFMVLYLARERKKEVELSELILESALERGKASEFIQEGKDSVDEEYRGKAILSANEGLESTLLEKGKATEHLFRTIYSKHLFQKRYNPFLQKKGVPIEGKLTSLQGAEGAALFQDTMLNIFKTASLQEAFLEELEELREEKKYFYKENISLLRKKLFEEPYLAKNRGLFLKESKEFLKDAQSRGYIDPYALVDDMDEMYLYSHNSLKEILPMLKEKKALLEEMEKKEMHSFSNNELDGLKKLKEEIENLKNKVEEIQIFQKLFKQTKQNTLHNLEKAEDIIRKGSKEALSKEALRKRVSSTLSQKGAYSFLKDGNYGKDIDIVEYNARYSSGFKKMAMLQDLEALDTLMGKKMKVYEERVLSGDIQDTEKLESQLQALTANKVLVRERYLKEISLENQNLSSEEIFKSVFDSHREDILKSADVRVGLVELSDGRVQILSGDRTVVGRVNAEMIENIMEESTKEKGNNMNIITKIEEVTGIKLGDGANENYTNPVSHDKGQFSTNVRKNADELDREEFLKTARGIGV